MVVESSTSVPSVSDYASSSPTIPSSASKRSLSQPSASDTAPIPEQESTISHGDRSKDSGFNWKAVGAVAFFVALCSPCVVGCLHCCSPKGRRGIEEEDECCC